MKLLSHTKTQRLNVITPLLISLLIAGWTCVANAADPDAVLTRMRELLSKYKSKELTVEFEKEDFSAWPASAAAKTVDALQLRGRAYMVVKDGPRSEADFKQALKIAPKNASTWLSFGENYFRNLDSDLKALAAFDEVRKITGESKGWERLTATLFSVQLLVDDLKTDEALALLQPFGDLRDLAPIWRIKMLRAYGHVYAAQGKEAESVAKFREALQVEAESQKPAK